MIRFFKKYNFILLASFLIASCDSQESATIIYGDESEYEAQQTSEVKKISETSNDLVIEDATPITEDYNINPNKTYDDNSAIEEGSVAEIASNNKIDKNAEIPQNNEIIIEDARPNKPQTIAGETIKISSLTHIVEAGETLYSLSRKYNIPILPIIISNNLEQPYSLKSGQKIKIPEGTFHIVGDADTLYSISRKYNVDMSALTQINQLSEPYRISKGQKLQIPFSSSNIANAEIVQSSPSTTKRVINYEQNINTENLVRAENQMQGGPASLQKSHKSVFAFKKTGDNETALAKDALNDENINTQKVENKIAENTAIPVNPTKPVLNNVKPKAPETKIAFSNEVKTSAPKIIEDKNISKQGFIWPVKGKIIKNFGTQKNNEYNDGVNISANSGAEVKASAAGRVVYTGDSLKSFGNLVIIKHDNGLLSAYAHMDKINVTNDQKVARGQVIGNVGSTGKVNSPQLYFAVRKGKDAKDPNSYLPKL